MEIIEYSLENCSACKKMIPIIKKLKKSGINIKVIDCDEDPSKCEGLEYVPTIIIKKGKKSKKIIGFVTAKKIKSEIKKIN